MATWTPSEVLEVLSSASGDRNLGTNNDRWIVEHVFPGKRHGYFVEAGAFDGQQGSSCYVLEHELDWTGICIEPNNTVFARLAENRPKSFHENVCLDRSTGKVAFVQDDERPMRAGVEENMRRLRKDWTEDHGGKLLTKPSATLRDVLRRNRAPRVIDYLAMDIEGSERPVLEAFPFDEYTFLAISVEGWNANDVLLDAGYVLVKNPFNDTKLFEQYFVAPRLLSWRQQLRRRRKTGRVMRRIPGTEQIVHLAAPPEVVWELLTVPERTCEWWGISAELDPSPGGAIRVTLGDGAVIAGRYFALDRPRRLVFRFGWEPTGAPDVAPESSIVDLLLEPRNGGTTLRLRHHGLPDNETGPQHREDWRCFLGRLVDAARTQQGDDTSQP
jgi:FkbM family methyltransferase